MTNRDRLSPTTSSANVGRCAISIAVTSLANVRHMTLCETPRPSVRTRRWCWSCGVEAREAPQPVVLVLRDRGAGSASTRGGRGQAPGGRARGGGGAGGARRLPPPPPPPPNPHPSYFE